MRLGLFRKIWGIYLLREVCLLELFDVHDKVIVVISFICFVSCIAGVLHLALGKRTWVGQSEFDVHSSVE